VLLKTAAEEKKQRAAESEKAIHNKSKLKRTSLLLLQKWQEKQDLEVSYSYKYPEIAERIEILRKQQLKQITSGARKKSS